MKVAEDVTDEVFSYSSERTTMMPQENIINLEVLTTVFKASNYRQRGHNIPGSIPLFAVTKES